MPQKTEKLEKKVFNISGMTCASCVNTIESYVKSQDGIEDISINLLSEKAEVTFNREKVNSKNIIQWTDDIGFGVEEIEDDDSLMVDIQGMPCASCVNTIENYVRWP